MATLFVENYIPNMKELRLLSVTFDTEIPPREISAFRGSIIEKVGLDREQYHNHNNQPGERVKFHYRYPLVQYKRYRKRPMLLFLDHGVDEAKYFFSQPDWILNFAGKTREAAVHEMRVKPYQLKVVEGERHYKLVRWIPLNQQNFQKYDRLQKEEAKRRFLEKVLMANIHSFAEGIDWRIDGWVEIRIDEIIGKYGLKHKGVRRMAFDVKLRTNIVLPPFIGLGKGVSHGFGMLWPIRKETKEQE